MACERREELAAAKKVRALTAAEATELADLELVTREADRSGRGTLTSPA